jgi:diguanylate cyclase (GGDEF)-like protein/PAS domain S-box-containing protein
MQWMDQDSATVLPNLLQLHFDHAVDGMFVLEPESDVYLKVNPAMCELLGFTHQQLVEARRPISALSIVHEDDRSIVLSHREAISEPGNSGVMRFRVVRTDGTLRHVEVRYAVIRYVGRLVEVGIARDVSNQVRLEQKLRSESEFNRELTIAAQRNATEAERKSEEVQEANTRLHALTEVLRAIPVLTKQLLELDKLSDVFKMAARTMVNEARFSSCVVLLKDEQDRLEVRYAHPYRPKSKVLPAEDPIARIVLEGHQSLVVRDDGRHAAAIRVGGEVRGILEVGLPDKLKRFFQTNRAIQQSIRDLVSTIADFLGVVIANNENLHHIRRQSRTDPLTGLFNRRVFDEQLTVEFRRALRYERDLSLMLMDIDNFGEFNNTYGHQQGDLMLQEIGHVLAGSFRDLDTVCRYGGEEIVVILPETVGAAARTKAEQIRRKIAELRIPRLEGEGEPLGVTLSIGIACLGKHIESEEELLREADKALYQCKNTGRNQVMMAPVYSTQ